MANCLDILNGWCSVRDWNSTLIALIPKTKALRRVSDYRPISLCNVSYKIITKVIANRLKNVLNNLISETQSAFISGRVISDIIVFGHECIHAMKKKRKGVGGMTTLKLDMSKAYDHVEWVFLEKLMRKMGFEKWWVDLVTDCITTHTFSILINGEAKGNIIPRRGLR